MNLGQDKEMGGGGGGWDPPSLKSIQHMLLSSNPLPIMRHARQPSH